MSSMDVPADGLTAAQAVRKAATQPVFICWLALAFMTTASVARAATLPRRPAMVG